MSKRKLESDDGPTRKRAPNFKQDEVRFLLNKIRKSKGTLFGALSPKLTFHMKTDAWLKIREELAAAGYPKRAKEQIKKKWEDVSSATKAKYHKKMKTGGGAIEWSENDDMVTEILGKENPSLTSIDGGIDSGESSTTQLSTNSLDGEQSDGHEALETTSEQFNSEQDISWEENVPQQPKKEEKKSPQVRAGDTTIISNLYEQQLKEEHEIKMRVLRKKEQLLDLQITIAKDELAQITE